MQNKSDFILWFSEIKKEDLYEVGEKGLNLGLLEQNKIPIPEGFIVTSQVYVQFLKANKLISILKKTLQNIDNRSVDSILHATSLIKKHFLQAKIPDQCINEILLAYKRLNKTFGLTPLVISTYVISPYNHQNKPVKLLNKSISISGEANLINYIKEVYANLFEINILNFKNDISLINCINRLALIVQKEISFDKSGFIYTIDPINHDRSEILIETIKKADKQDQLDSHTSEEYIVSKKDLLIIKKITSSNNNNNYYLNNRQIIDLAKIGKKIESLLYYPQEISWAIKKNEYYITGLQAISNSYSHLITGTNNHKNEHPVAIGKPASPGIITGRVTILNNISNFKNIKSNSILITDDFNAKELPLIKKSIAIITERGSKKSFAAINARNLGIPAVIGVENATKIFKQNQIITVNGAKGEIYNGGINKNSILNLSNKLQTAIKIFTEVNYGDKTDPEKIEAIDGIVINNSKAILQKTAIHPKKLINEKNKSLFQDILFEFIKEIDNAVNPKPVIYKLSDLLSSDLRSLSGGNVYEPKELNPLLGFHGAYRMINDPKIISMELEVISRLKNQSQNNIWLLIPYVRSVKELINIKRLLSSYDLHRSPNFKVFINLSVPSNIPELPKLIETGIDGIFIDTNTLIPLLTGTDYENEEMAYVDFDKKEILIWLYQQILNITKKENIFTVLAESSFNYSLLYTTILNLGINGITIPISDLESARYLLTKEEQKLLI